MIHILFDIRNKHINVKMITQAVSMAIQGLRPILEGVVVKIYSMPVAILAMPC